jgi:hypothetical protein
VELFCLILLDYSVWKMYQTIFFFIFSGKDFFKTPVQHVLKLKSEIYLYPNENEETES